MRKAFRRACAALSACLCLAWLMPAFAAAAPLSDVPDDHWAQAYVTQALELGLMDRQQDGSFGLHQPMTRADFVAALCRVFQWETVSPETSFYTDNQNPSAWYYSAIETARANGALTVQTPLCRPNDAITREEVAVMLVRALGYGPISGLAQELRVPFQDLNTNVGYISMAYELGLVNGTSSSAFSPNEPTTREQAAVFLIRVWTKLHAAAPAVCGVASSADGLDLKGIDAVAVPAVKLAYHGSSKIADNMNDTEVRSIRAIAEECRTKQLLYVSGDTSILRSDSSETAYDIVSEVRRGSWDGVMLDLPGLGMSYRTGYTLLASALRSALPEGKLLYVVADSPVRQGDSPQGYDYTMLSARADRLILRTASYNMQVNQFFTAPLEPMEEIYYALAEMKGKVPTDCLSLWITSTGVSGTSSIPLPQLAQITSNPYATYYYAQRYESPYLTYILYDQPITVWYHNRQSVQARRQLASLFNCNHICLSSLSGPLDQENGILAALQ